MSGVLVAVRNKQGYLKYKDILKLDYDMSVQEPEKGKFVVCLNRKFIMNDYYHSRDEAEAAMTELADKVNSLEEAQTAW